MLDKHCIKVSEGLIWGLIPSTVGQALALEIRNKELKTVRFAIYRLGQTDLTYLNTSEPFDWWASLKAFKDNIYIFSRWQDALNPASVRLWAIDSQTQQVLWEKTDFQFVSAQSDGCWALWSNHLNPKTQLLDWRTGNAIEQNETLPQTNKSYILPFHYTETDGHFDTVKRFLLERNQQVAMWASDYLEWEGLVFISYYLKEADSLANFLLIMREDGKILLTEKLESDLKAVGVSTFFIFENHLIFVRDKSELLAIPVKSF